jgi:hypothetical protein
MYHALILDESMIKARNTNWMVNSIVLGYSLPIIVSMGLSEEMQLSIQRSVRC